eukprot:3155875-Amphidinium_carterae.1
MDVGYVCLSPTIVVIALVGITFSRGGERKHALLAGVAVQARCTIRSIRSEGGLSAVCDSEGEECTENPKVSSMQTSKRTARQPKNQTKWLCSSKRQTVVVTAGHVPEPPKTQTALLAYQPSGELAIVVEELPDPLHEAGPHRKAGVAEFRSGGVGEIRSGSGFAAWELPGRHSRCCAGCYSQRSSRSEGGERTSRALVEASSGLERGRGGLRRDGRSEGGRSEDARQAGCHECRGIALGVFLYCWEQSWV